MARALHQSLRPVIGRFAPSPTGMLHLGSLTTAVASFCHIKSLGGQWLLRIEDVDFERCKSKYTQSILDDLENLGLTWDQSVTYQSDRLDIYNAIIQDKLKTLTYPCQCSRKQLQDFYDSHPHAFTPVIDSSMACLSQTESLNAPPIYPRLCLHQAHDEICSKIRLQLPDVMSGFFDGLQGMIWDNPAKSLGDVVIKRQNNMINYILSCAIDDGLQNITHVMRGLDILPMTIAQLSILAMCQLPTPDYFYHLPLLHNPDGQKLSKQNLAKPIHGEKPSQLLTHCLTLLGQPIAHDMASGTPSEILAFAISNWTNTPLKNKTSLGISKY
ncbi:tRNA glutamyl-Q(34) synthetase GluQRS [Moraxella nasovis]|uniref:tRNA glutamyl-Q(34) synthetase GluQRS n=1 Tax=Moraxella nasovis TaxID=2904121 RepID=UPI001F61F68C|nr:tRNA glutamyl-Q(34) synthetase GluQRS [Moraxella nasovis]UNU72694.1 tRNA glutamyl-Q(34) synthetase GluQRS [Moraxella nasovis]